MKVILGRKERQMQVEIMVRGSQEKYGKNKTMRKEEGIL
jgi:hypothetical protein